jgi:hypothetical protein
VDRLLPPSAFGAELYQAGQALVRDHGLRLDRIMWDADEVMWDWVMSLADVRERLPGFLWGLDLGHREYVRLKPGVIELLLGMHRASLDLGLDPHVRIWTNGYPYRMWMLTRAIPALGTLLGPPHATPADLGAHPRVFTRLHYPEAAIRLLVGPDRDAAWADLPPATAAVLRRQLARNPLDSHLKIPDLAALVGKPGFAQVEILVDDRPANVARFAATGRRGVRVVSEAPSVLGGRVPNTVWRDPWGALEALATDVAHPLARALRRLAARDPGLALAVRGVGPAPGAAAVTFTLDIPGDRVWQEWIEPGRALRRWLKRCPEIVTSNPGCKEREDPESGAYSM